MNRGPEGPGAYLRQRIDSGPWVTVESDPAVFTAMMTDLGVRGAQVEDIWWPVEECDEHWNDLGEVYGLIFLFKLTDYEVRGEHPPSDADDWESVYFANQVIENACATQALLNIVLNNDDRVEIGDMLREFKEFTELMASPLRGLSMTNDPRLRNIHNQFARADDLIPSVVYWYEQRSEEERKLDAKGKAKATAKAKKNTKKDEWVDEEPAYHYTAYVFVNGIVWELDGLARYPIKLGRSRREEWLNTARGAMSRKMKSNPSIIEFSCLAIVRDRVELSTERLMKTLHKLQVTEQRLEEFDKSWRQYDGFLEADYQDFMPLADGAIRDDLSIVEIGAQVRACNSLDELLNIRLGLFEEVLRARETLVEVRQTQKERKEEALHRRHNYVPFILQFFEILHRKGELERRLHEALEFSAIDEKVTRQYSGERRRTTSNGGKEENADADADADAEVMETD